VRGKRSKWAPLLLLAFLLAGCWDRREIEERNTSLASGVDLCTKGQGCTLMATRQIAIPGRISTGSSASGGSSDGTVFILRSPGVDGPDTLRHAQAALNHTLSFGHTRVLVWSEEFARSSHFTDYVDYVRRVPDARPLMWMAIVEGRAEDVIRARPPLDRVPALFLADMFDDAANAGRLPKVRWGEFLNRLANKGEDAVAPMIRMTGNDQPAISGLAVFRGNRMVGRLTPDEMLTYMQVAGRNPPTGLLTMDLPGGDRADLRATTQTVSYKLRTAQGRIHATVNIMLECDLIDLSPHLNGSDRHVREQIESRAAADVTRKANALVEKLQKEFGADVLGLGERVRAHKPATWKSINDWHTAFTDARFQFEVQVKIRRTGMAVH
jgi:spore germination protein KC